MLLGCWECWEAKRRFLIAETEKRKIKKPPLRNHILPNSVFVTDQLNLYNETSQIFRDHLTVNHKIGYVVDGISTNNIENAWKHLKKMIEGTYFHLSHHHFDGYLYENTYRWNRRDEPKKVLFEDFMPFVFDKRITYKELKSRKENKMAA